MPKVSPIPSPIPHANLSSPPPNMCLMSGAASEFQPTCSDVPTAFLRAELAKRQHDSANTACGSGNARESYNTSLHVAALIIILVLSTAGRLSSCPSVSNVLIGATACSFPIIVRRFPSLPVPHHFLFLSRHFGTGVLIATAFVHLLPTAFVSLTDPCLPPFWNHGYPAMAGLIAMTSVLVVVGIEMFFATRGAGHIHGSDYDMVPGEQSHDLDKHVSNRHVQPTRPRSDSIRRFRQAAIGGHANGTPLGIMSSSTEDLVAANPKVYPDATETLYASTHSPNLDSDSEFASLHPSGPNNPSNSTHQTQQKLLLQCLLLEAGILFHSIFIGIALSVATGTSFLVLLLAISFHQTFEGLALGSRIAAIPQLSPSSPKPWLMALAYGTTTPLGQAIGLGVHGLYDPAGETGLLMVGVMNAVSSGLLLFAGLVELLAEDFLSDRSYNVLNGRRRIQACVAVIAGAALMALVGAWA